ncbi:hypothetical protein B6D60_08485, partial [candidate division KSB1 bacterium 4484_87]
MKSYTSLLLTLLLLLGTASLLIAGDLFQGHSFKSGLVSPSKMTQMRIAYFNPFQDSQQDTTPLTREQQLARLPGYKLPKKALFFSALIPGAGELFVGSKMKAAAFFLVEVGAWTYYGVYHQKGAKKEDEFEEYADAHWDPLKWKNWYETEGQNLIELTGDNKYTHAPAMLELIEAGKKTQQYYEMLGKYSEFVVGWEGVDPNKSFSTYEEMQEFRDSNVPVADEYMDMRDESNDLYHMARRG